MTVAELGLGSLLLFTSAAMMADETSDRSSASATQISVSPQSAQKVILGTPNHFIGSARVQSLFDAKPPSHETGGIVTFQPGSRSVWHTHPLGQVLIVTEGEGLVQAWGGPVQVMHKGDVIWIPAGVKHCMAHRPHLQSRTLRFWKSKTEPTSFGSNL